LTVLSAAKQTPDSEKGVRLAQTMQVGPCIPVGIYATRTESARNFSLKQPEKAFAFSY
jgi:hypothetical protein